MTRQQILTKLRNQLDAGKPIVGGGAGTGISAKAAEAGGIDLIIIYNSGRFRMRLPSFSGHPISADLVSVGEDVHCEFVKEEVHPGVPA